MQLHASRFFKLCSAIAALAALTANRELGWPKDLKAKDLMADAMNTRKDGWPPSPPPGDARRNTTISLVIVNQALAPWELQRLAVQVHTSLLAVTATDFTVPGRYPLLLPFDTKGALVINPGRWQQSAKKARR